MPEYPQEIFCIMKCGPFRTDKREKNKQRWKQTHEQTVCGFTLTVWDGDTWTAVCHGLEEACWAPDTSDDPLCPRSPTSLQHRARDVSGQQQMSAFAFHLMYFIVIENMTDIHWLISHVIFQHPLSNLVQTRAIISYQLDEQRTDDHTEKSHGLIRNARWSYVTIHCCITEFSC